MSERNDLYKANQRLFDEHFAKIMITTFVGFERSTFDQLAGNDDYLPPFDPDIPEGTSTHWADGTPLPLESEDGHA